MAAPCVPPGILMRGGTRPGCNPGSEQRAPLPRRPKGWPFLAAWIALSAAAAGAQTEELPRDLRTELVDAAALDYGKCLGVVFEGESPTDIHGFLHLAPVYSVWTEPSKAVGDGLRALSQALNDSTRIASRVLDPVQVSSHRLHVLPVVFLAGSIDPERATRQEIDNLREYVRRGGLLVLGRPLDRPGWRWLQEILGQRPRIQRIAAEHELHHVYYHLPGPPFFSLKGLSLDYYGAYAEVYRLDDRVAAIGTNGTWSVGALGARHRHEERGVEEELKLGINLCVYAMRLPGGIVAQNMRSIRSGR